MLRKIRKLKTMTYHLYNLKVINLVQTLSIRTFTAFNGNTVNGNTI